MTCKLPLVFSAALAITLLGYLYFESLVLLFGHWIGSSPTST